MGDTSQAAVQKLTKTLVDKVRYPDDGMFLDDAGRSHYRRFTIWDRDLKGFGLRVYPSGRKVFVFRYKIAGRQRWLTIGDYGAFTVHSARRRAEIARGHMADGIDPAEARRQRRERARFLRDLAAEYMEELRAKRKASTVRSYEQLLKGHILPRFGNLRPAAITDDDVVRFHRRMGKTPYAANRALFLLGKLLRVAEKKGLREPGMNPCDGVRRYPERARKRYLSNAELVQLGDALARLEDQGVHIRSEHRVCRISPHAAAAIRLLLFTGCRVSEILKLRWEDLDFELKVARLPDSKTGERFFPLTSPALEVLSTVPRNPGDRWVIRGQNEGQNLTDLAVPWRRAREAAGLSGVRLHDLRHTVGAWGASGGLSLLLVGKMLGHRQAASAERYAHLSADPVREAAERVSGAIRAAMDGDSARVIPLEIRK